jgi:hypothetical protein
VAHDLVDASFMQPQQDDCCGRFRDTLGGCPSSAKAQITEICHLIAIIVKDRKSCIVGMRDRIAD